VDLDPIPNQNYFFVISKLTGFFSGLSFLAIDQLYKEKKEYSLAVG